MKSAIVASMEKKGIVCHCYGDATDLHLMLRNIHKNIQRHYFLNSRISVCDSNQSLLFFFFPFYPFYPDERKYSVSLSLLSFFVTFLNFF